jgi:hypothetical protein
MKSCCRQSYAGYLPLDVATTLIQRDDNYDWLQIELLFKRGTDVSKIINALERLANERMNPNSRELKVGPACLHQRGVCSREFTARPDPAEKPASSMSHNAFRKISTRGRFLGVYGPWHDLRTLRRHFPLLKRLPAEASSAH